MTFYHYIHTIVMVIRLLSILYVNVSDCLIKNIMENVTIKTWLWASKVGNIDRSWHHYRYDLLDVLTNRITTPKTVSSVRKKTATTLSWLYKKFPIIHQGHRAWQWHMNHILLIKHHLSFKKPKQKRQKTKKFFQLIPHFVFCTY